VPPRAAPSAPVPPELAELERFAATLASILADARGQEPPLGFWQSVSHACANPPVAPAAGDVHGTTAHQLLGEACETLRAAIALEPDPALPVEAQRREALEQAAARLAAAQAELARAARL
jgi:hypothetical protein